MTLVEVVIALGLSALLSAGMYASAIYTMRQTAKNVEHIFAVQLASSEAACVRASRFNKLRANPTVLPSSDFEKRFASSRSVAMNAVDPHSPVFAVAYNFTGFGTGIAPSAGGGPTEWWFTVPAHSAGWAEDQFKDHLVVITGGEGANQVMYILDHDATEAHGSGRRTKVRLTSDLTGANSGGSYGWPTKNPGSSSMYAVDYGLYCDVAVSWDDGVGYKTVTETVYVPNSR